MNDARWLSDEEQASWRAWIEVMRVLPTVLEEGLHSRDKLNLTDYQVLVQLSESAEGRMRMTELSHSTHLSKSRLSHQVKRMEEAGLVARADCPDDRRGSFAEITEHGLATIRAAAPEHVQDVRRFFLDRLTPEQIEILGVAMISVADGLRGRCRAHLAKEEAAEQAAASGEADAAIAVGPETAAVPGMRAAVA
ncbi:MAG TPA: MarR family transcriptional regulator [Actinocrinis sp.]|nr:MarR family transcriptional regulator [Actinocrinis sp.]